MEPEYIPSKFPDPWRPGVVYFEASVRPSCYCLADTTHISEIKQKTRLYFYIVLDPQLGSYGDQTRTLYDGSSQALSKVNVWCHCMGQSGQQPYKATKQSTEAGIASYGTCTSIYSHRRDGSRPGHDAD